MSVSKWTRAAAAAIFSLAACLSAVAQESIDDTFNDSGADSQADIAPAEEEDSISGAESEIGIPEETEGEAGLEGEPNLGAEEGSGTHLNGEMAAAGEEESPEEGQGSLAGILKGGLSVTHESATLTYNGFTVNGQNNGGDFPIEYTRASLELLYPFAIDVNEGGRSDGADAFLLGLGVAEYNLCGHAHATASRVKLGEKGVFAHAKLGFLGSHGSGLGVGDRIGYELTYSFAGGGCYEYNVTRPGDTKVSALGHQTLRLALSHDWDTFLGSFSFGYGIRSDNLKFEKYDLATSGPPGSLPVATKSTYNMASQAYFLKGEYILEIYGGLFVRLSRESGSGYSNGEIELGFSTVLF